jgi:hypothetical protein
MLSCADLTVILFSEFPLFPKTIPQRSEYRFQLVLCASPLASCRSRRFRIAILWVEPDKVKGGSYCMLHLEADPVSRDEKRNKMVHVITEFGRLEARNAIPF